MSDPESDASALDGSVEAARGDVTREWELFVRESAGDPLRHVGSVSAPSAAVAREQAAKLFDWTAETLWLCPADETRRFTGEDVALGDRAGESDATGGESA